MIIKQISMELKRAFRYPFGILSDIMVYGGLLLFFMLSDTGKSFGETYGYTDYKALFLIGYCAWIYAVAAVASLSQEIIGEMKQGTFYRLCNSRYPLHILLFGKMLVQFILQSGMIIVFLLGGWLLGKVEVPFSWQLMVSVAISSIGMYGIGMILAGFTVYYKKTGTIIYLVQLGLLFVTDTLPTSAAVSGVTSLIPLTACNIIMRKIIAGQKYVDILLWLIIISIIWVCIGALMLQWFYNKSRKKGNLLFY